MEPIGFLRFPAHAEAPTAPRLTDKQEAVVGLLFELVNRGRPTGRFTSKAAVSSAWLACAEKRGFTLNQMMSVMGNTDKVGFQGIIGDIGESLFGKEWRGLGEEDQTR